MKKPLFHLPPHPVISLLMNFCLGFGLCRTLLLMCAMPVSLGLQVAACAAVSLFFFLSSCIPLLRRLLPLLLLASAGLFVFSYREQLQDIGTALTMALYRHPLSLAIHTRFFFPLIVLISCGIAAGFSAMEIPFAPTGLLCVLSGLGLIFTGHPEDLPTALALASALLLSARCHGTPALRLLATAVPILLLLPLLAPRMTPVSTPDALREAAEQTRRFISDYLFFNEMRLPFSLSSTGWQPLGNNRLGGPVNEEALNVPVMHVQTGVPLLLRGGVRNEFTGFAWADTVSSRRYLYINPGYRALRANVFDLNRPGGQLARELPGWVSVTVLPDAEGTSTLWVTQRFQRPAGRNMALYYSTSSELFETRNLTAEDQYAFEARPLTCDTEGIREVVLSAVSLEDPWYEEEIRTRYLALPENLDSRVGGLARQITSGDSLPFDQAMSLTRYLRTRFPYTLEQSVPPTTQDFVSWFLFTEQKGYCTSFASALTVMARSLGIPARYIEGYRVTPGDNGIAQVTQHNAHAWTELYFPGFGWLTFDPTPSDRSSPDSPRSDETPPPGELPEPSPSPTPTPSPLPSQTPTPQPSEPPEEPSPEPSDASSTPPTPSPSPEPDTTMPPLPSPTPPVNPDPPRPVLPWVLLALLILVLLCALRLWLISPARRAAGQTPGTAIAIYYGALLDALRILGFQPAPGEAPYTFLSRSQRALGQGLVLTPLASVLYSIRYSAHSPGRQQVAQAHSLYRQTVERMTLRQRISHLVYRFIHGNRTWKKALH